MARKNDKKLIINDENSIAKSNEFSMAKLNHGLTLNQMQLLAFAIYCTQKNGRNEFHKADFEKKFGIGEYRKEDISKDSKKLYELGFATEDLENDYFDYLRVFQRITYKNGLVTFKWSEDLLPHILDLQDKYNLTDIDTKSKFRSSFSWILYDYLKGAYGYWHKPFSKDALMNLFCVEHIKSYQANTALFKKKVLDFAISEVNQYTEFEVWYKEEKEGRAIVGFDLAWSQGEKVVSATKKQIKELKTVVEAILEDQLNYVNLKDDELRVEAIQYIHEIRTYIEYTSEPICIVKERADFVLQKANWILRRLEQMQEEDKKPTKFYNWLEERE